MDKNYEERKILTEGHFSRCSVAPPTARLSLYSLPLGSCSVGGNWGCWWWGYRWLQGGWTNAKPAWTGGQLTPVALRSTEAQTDRAFLQPSLRRVLLDCLGTYALRHDVGNLRQWTPRRDFIRFWRYVDCDYSVTTHIHAQSKSGFVDFCSLQRGIISHTLKYILSLH